LTSIPGIGADYSGIYMPVLLVRLSRHNTNKKQVVSFPSSTSHQPLATCHLRSAERISPLPTRFYAKWQYSCRGGRPRAPAGDRDGRPYGFPVYPGWAATPAVCGRHPLRARRGLLQAPHDTFQMPPYATSRVLQRGFYYG